MQRLCLSSVRAHVVDEARHREGALRHVDQMRAAVFVEPPGGGRGGEEAGMAAHDDRHIDAGQRAEIEVDRQERAGDEFGGRDEARRVVVFHQIVVDGLRRMHEGHRAAGCVGQDLLRARGVVAADIDEGVGAGLLQAVEHQVAIGGVRLVAGRAERGARRAGDQPKLLLGQVGQHDIVAVAHAAHAVPRAEHARLRVAAADFQRGAHHGLVDHRGRPAALRDHECLGHAQNPPSSLLLRHKCPSLPASATPFRQKARACRRSWQVAARRRDFGKRDLAPWPRIS